ncbi:hypothetical protein E0K83_07570 [Gramella sp. BOM4]|nr:hypothetical protein [Christiangramia bathymodioli]
MLELITREDCLNRNKTLAAYLKNVQANVYAPDRNDLLFIPGENYLEEEQKWVVLSEKECEERNRPIIREFEEKRDKLPSVLELGSYEADAILSSDTGNFDHHIDVLAEGLQKLDKDLEWGGLMFIMEYPFPWLTSLDPERDKDALEYFRSLVDKEDCSSAIFADGEDLKVLLRHLLHLEMYNFEYPKCSFAAVQSSAIGSFCKYGNIHYLFYETQEKQKFDQFLLTTRLLEIPFPNCKYQF